MKKPIVAHSLILVAIAVLVCSCAKTVNGCKIEPATDCRGADLVGVDLSKSQLSAADFTDAELRGANLRGANLNWANLSNADLRGSNMRESILSGAILRGARYDVQTEWPEGFDPVVASAVLVSEDK